MSLFPDYLQRRLGEDMLHLNIVVGPYHWNSNLELVYTPSFRKIKFAEEGPWAPGYISILNQIAPSLAGNGISVVEPEYNQFEDGQFAVRWTHSVAGIDYGLSYYNGVLRIPAFEMGHYVKQMPTEFRISSEKTLPFFAFFRY